MIPAAGSQSRQNFVWRTSAHLSKSAPPVSHQNEPHLFNERWVKVLLRAGIRDSGHVVRASLGFAIDATQIGDARCRLRANLLRRGWRPATHPVSTSPTDRGDVHARSRTRAVEPPKHRERCRCHPPRHPQAGAKATSAGRKSRAHYRRLDRSDGLRGSPPPSYSTPRRHLLAAPPRHRQGWREIRSDDDPELVRRCQGAAFCEKHAHARSDRRALPAADWLPGRKTPHERSCPHA